MKKYVLLGLLFITVLTGASCALNTSTNTPAANTTAVEQEVKTTLLINKGKGNASPVRTFETTVPAGTTAMGLLDRVAAANTITIAKQRYEGLGDLVSGIDGLEATDKAFWLFYVNGKAATVGAQEYVVQSGDTIEFRYGDGSEDGS